MSDIRQSPVSLPLPMRERTKSRQDPSAVSEIHQSQPRVDTEAMGRELQVIRGRVDRINGLLLASRDGLLLCGDTRGPHEESVAAMAAATIGLAGKFTDQAMVGEPRAAVFEGMSGHVCIFPVDTAILLVVFGERDTNTGLFTVAARQALAQVQMAINRHTVS
ncbi:roadblock/LC7 domain-containing protein [Actinocrispum sp. NPDC049592]|uniref:roadblock/LC7 domain-containing protein n=1 Tax=Actinocrispum sp. NPDC049592 TaxID=3154835 RepID=UPI003425CA09